MGGGGVRVQGARDYKWTLEAPAKDIKTHMLASVLTVLLTAVALLLDYAWA